MSTKNNDRTSSKKDKYTFVILTALAVVFSIGTHFCLINSSLMYYAFNNLATVVFFIFPILAICTMIVSSIIVFKKKKISYAINLVAFNREDPYDRLGNSIKYLEILGHNIPMLNLPVSGARSMAEIIEVAVTNLKLKEEGFDSTFEFENRMNELLTRKKMKLW